MKSFLDRFRRKREAEPPRKPETSAEIAREAIEAGYSPTLQRRTGTKGEVPPGAAEPGRPAPAAREAPLPMSQRDETVSFELADFLPRIPEQLLAKGPFDPKLLLTFDLGELSARIARGQTTFSLAEIYRRLPQLFRGEIRETDNIEIRFPWQKLLQLVKAADASTPGAGLTETAAEALAQKLRSRKRNINAAPAPVDKTAPRFPPGHRQPSWFSRPGAGTAPAAPTAKAEAGPAVPPQEPAAPAPKKPVEPSVPPLGLAKPASVPSVETAPVEAPAGAISFGPAGADGTPEPTPAEAASAADAAAESGSSEQQQLEALAVERQVFADQRDQALGELSRLLKEVDEHRNEAELQKGLVDKSRQLAAVATAERDAVRQELEAQAALLEERSREFRALEETVAQLKASAAEKEAVEARLNEERSTAEAQARELDSLRVEIGQIQQSATGELAEIREERDALLQQKTHLTQQLAQFQKSATVSSEAIATEGERSRREYQRQLEELQRRILALESSQKESAHELGREREARIKAERAASAADRSRGEAAALVESIRGEMRREAEAVNRKRDAELARLQKESYEKIEALTDTQRKAVSERDELAAEVAALKKTAQEGGAAAAGAVDKEWESRAVASLEADIENYRGRIKTLLKEREALTKAKDQGASDAADEGAFAELKAAHEKLGADLAAVREDRARLAAQLQEISQRLAHAESGSSIALAAQQERASAELSHAEAQLAALRRRHETLDSEHSETLARVDELKAQLAGGAGLEASALEMEQLRGEIASLQSALTEARAETESVSAQRDAAHADVQRLGREVETVGKAVAEESEAALREVREHLAAERETTAQLAADRDAARAEAAKLGTEVEEVRSTAAAEREAAIQATRAEFEVDRKKANTARQRALVAERDALAAELERTRKDFETQLATLRRDLDFAKTSDLAAGTELAAVRSDLADLKAAGSAAEEKIASLARERDESREQIEAAENKLRDAAAQLSAKEEELAKTLREHERASAKLNAEKEKEVAAALGEKVRSVSAAEKERDQLAAALDAERNRTREAATSQEKELAAKTAALIEERDLARRESTAVAQRLAAMALEFDEKCGMLQAQLEARTQEKGTLWSELEAARETFDSQSAVFARELKSLTKQRDEALTALDNARANLQEKAAALARERVALESAVEDVKHRTDRELARLRRERDVLVRQRDDLRTRITRMVEEQNKLLDELGTQAGRGPVHPSDISPEPPAPREANVIDINEADVVKDIATEDPSSSGVRPPRIRPVPIPPPNVRIL